VKIFQKTRQVEIPMADTGFAQNHILIPLAGEAAQSDLPLPPKYAAIVRWRESGDEEAFGEVYRLYAPMVHGVLLAKLPADHVPDAVQEVFLLAHRNINKLRDVRAFGGWLVAIARNQAASTYRSRKETDEIPEDIPGRDDRRAEAAEALAAIRSLPPAYRETLVMRLVEGLTGDEIASLTGLSPDSVRVNLHRGMNLLRKALGVRK
jgi:RNA polymerase sigma-70 factor (ECF subfamily)